MPSGYQRVAALSGIAKPRAAVEICETPGVTFDYQRSLQRRMRAMHSLYEDACSSMNLDHVNHVERDGVTLSTVQRCP